MINQVYRVDDKVGIVTGAGQGIGKAIALTLADAGANIATVDINLQKAEEVSHEIKATGCKTLAMQADVSKEDQVKEVVKKTISQFGRIDILVNNAGITLRKSIAVAPGVKIPMWVGTETEPQTLEEWRKVMDVNLASTFLFAQAVGPYMIEQRKGKVINISSTCADEGIPGVSAYSASKAGVSTFTRCLASEWGPFNINVNAVAPGMIETELTVLHLKDEKRRKAVNAKMPLGRVGKPRDVALLVLFLASAASDYITGQVITIDGGALGQGIGI